MSPSAGAVIALGADHRGSRSARWSPPADAAVRIRLPPFGGRGSYDGINVGMAELMPDFKRLVDAALPGEMDSLASQFDGFYRYAKVLETVAGGIATGEIDVPK